MDNAGTSQNRTEAQGAVEDAWAKEQNDRDNALNNAAAALLAIMAERKLAFIRIELVAGDSPTARVQCAQEGQPARTWSPPIELARMDLADHVEVQAY